MTLGLSETFDSAAQIDFRQLRHQTKNALTRILAQVSSGLGANDATRRVAAEVERRVLLTAQISDALFGFTRAPGPFPDRLWALCEGVVDLLGEADQHLTIRCDVQGEVADAQAEIALRVAHEFVGNAVKHGMPMRLLGRIDVTVIADASGMALAVSDDGWGCARACAYGEGMRVSAALADELAGAVSLRREAERTIACLTLPAVCRV